MERIASENDRERKREKAGKGGNLPHRERESTSSSPFSGHFGSKVRQGTAPLYIEATRLPPLPLFLFRSSPSLALLPPCLLSSLPRRVASRELTGEAGHLKYSSDAGLNEARPNVNLSTCSSPSSLCIRVCILHSKRACRFNACVCVCVCIFTHLLDYARRIQHTRMHRHRLLAAGYIGNYMEKDEIDSATNADFTYANVN